MRSIEICPNRVRTDFRMWNTTCPQLRSPTPRVVLAPSSYYPLPQRQPSGELLMSKIIFACFWIFCKWNRVLISFLPLSLSMISVSSFHFVACSISSIGYIHYLLFMQSSVNRLLICWDKNGTTSIVGFYK